MRKVTSACNSFPCINNGLCITNPSGFSCICKPGFTGYLCQTQIVVSDFLEILGRIIKSFWHLILKATTTSSTVTCQNDNGFDSSCSYFSLKYNACTIPSAYLNGKPFVVTCPKTCNTCNGGGGSGQITSTTGATTTSCQNIQRYEVSCNYFSQQPFSYCTNNLSFIGGMPFSVACKKSCNLC